MNIPDPLDPAVELERVAAALDWALCRDDWWGPARLAFDAEITLLRDGALSTASEMRSQS